MPEQRASFDRIEFRWLHPEEFTVLNGKVLVRNLGKSPEMVLDINDPAGATPYLIVGRLQSGKNWFGGRNSARGGANVSASWAEVDEGFVGRWIEDGAEYLFAFELR